MPFYALMTYALSLPVPHIPATVSLAESSTLPLFLTLCHSGFVMYMQRFTDACEVRGQAL